VKYPHYPKLKPSGVDWLGPVPAHWSVERGRFCMAVNPPLDSSHQLAAENEVSFVPMDAVGKNGGLSLHQSRQLAEIGSGYTAFQDGDVIVAKITPCFENGKGALAAGLVNGVAFGTTELHVLRATSKLDRRYLFYLTISTAYRKTGQAEMYGAGGQKRVPPEFNKNFRTPIPPLAEQCTIADFLDRKAAEMDALVAKKRTLIAKLKEKRSALIARSVARGLPPKATRTAGLDPQPKLKASGIDWLGDVPAHWNASKIKYVARVESGHTPSRSVEEYWVDCTIPWVSLNDSSYLREHDYISDTVYQINELGLANSSARILPSGSVIFSRDATIGLCAITTRPMAVSQHFIAYLCGPQLIASYLLFNLKAMGQNLERLSFGSTIVTIGMSDVKSLACAIPPISEQRAIIRFLEHEIATLARMIDKIEKAIECLLEYRAALITAAVAGKIDVRKASTVQSQDTVHQS